MSNTTQTLPPTQLPTRLELARHLLVQSRNAVQMIDLCSELAEREGWPAMARDLAIAMVTLQRFNSEYARELEADRIVGE